MPTATAPKRPRPPARGPSAAAEGDTGQAAPKSKKKLIVLAAVALVVLVAAGGYLLLGSKKPAAASKAVALGPVLSENALTINLADGHYLQVAPALQLAAGQSTDKFSANNPRILDITISQLSTGTMSELSAPGGLAKAKAALAAQLAKVYPGQVTGVYFTQFVMQ